MRFNTCTHRQTDIHIHAQAHAHTGTHIPYKEGANHVQIVGRFHKLLGDLAVLLYGIVA